MDAPLKVAVVIGQLSQGGSERQLYLFLAHCARSRWTPLVFVSGELGFWEEPIRALGIPVTLLRGDQVSKMRQFRAACIAQGVRRFFSWSSYTNAYALALVGLGVRCVGSFRNDLFADLPQRHRWVWSWMSLSGLATVVCNSQETRAALEQRVGRRKRVVYVPNAVQTFDSASIARLRTHWRTRLGVGDDEVLVVGVGRMVPQKNFVRFVEMIAEVRRSVPVRAALAGKDGGSLAAVQGRAAELGLGPEVVQFLGPVPDARELICAADVFVLSSDHEGMPNVVLEALAAGVPCVCTSVNGVQTLISHGETGFIAAPAAEALAQHVALLAQNAPLRRAVGDRAAVQARGTYGAEDITSRLWALCE